MKNMWLLVNVIGKAAIEHILFAMGISSTITRGHPPKYSETHFDPLGVFLCCISLPWFVASCSQQGRDAFLSPTDGEAGHMATSKGDDQKLIRFFEYMGFGFGFKMLLK